MVEIVPCLISVESSCYSDKSSDFINQLLLHFCSLHSCRASLLCYVPCPRPYKAVGTVTAYVILCVIPIPLYQSRVECA
jgi:hypothetical protein